MATAYQYDMNGYYAGKIEDHGLLPNNATSTMPEQQEGYIPRWNGTAWEQVENHKGEEGWLDGKPHKIEEYGPYPDGWSATEPEKSQQEKDAARITEIKAQLTSLDNESIRALRAIANDKGTDEDKAKLAELETQAEGLRAELATLETPEG